MEFRSQDLCMLVMAFQAVAADSLGPQPLHAATLKYTASKVTCSGTPCTGIDDKPIHSWH